MNAKVRRFKTSHVCVPGFRLCTRHPRWQVVFEQWLGAWRVYAPWSDEPVGEFYYSQAKALDAAKRERALRGGPQFPLAG